MQDPPLDAGDPEASRSRLHATLGARGLGRAARSAAFLLAYVGYLGTVVGLGQRLLLWPMIALFPRRRQSLVRGWLRTHAHGTLALARVLAGVRVRVDGAPVAAESCVVVMNHQSVLDIPIGLALVPGPYPLIPTRDRYKRGIPGVSPLARLAGFPFVAQGRALTRDELRALLAAADAVAAGERSLLIFPEGHRTRDGRIGPFMRSGLRLVLKRAKRPVYAVVADGVAVDGAVQPRTFAEALTRFAGTQVRVRVLGPFPPPPDGEIDAFVDALQARMTAALAELRGAPPSTAVEPQAVVAPPAADAAAG
jgi:1-acyl-sn-glycerol-3-phosphate acyltransferase